MSTRPRVKELIHSLITKLSHIVTSAKKYVKIANNFERKLSDVVAVRTNTAVYDTEHHNLTSVFSNCGLYKKAYGNEDNKKTVDQTKKKH